MTKTAYIFPNAYTLTTFVRFNAVFQDFINWAASVGATGTAKA